MRADLRAVDELAGARGNASSASPWASYRTFAFEPGRATEPAQSTATQLSFGFLPSTSVSDVPSTRRAVAVAALVRLMLLPVFGRA